MVRSVARCLLIRCRRFRSASLPSAPVPSTPHPSPSLSPPHPRVLSRRQVNQPNQLTGSGSVTGPGGLIRKKGTDRAARRETPGGVEHAKLPRAKRRHGRGASFLFGMASDDDGCFGAWRPAGPAPARGGGNSRTNGEERDRLTDRPAGDIEGTPRLC
jgi:hypothetical protein